MIETGPANANDMVLAFLRAEIDSPRFGDAYRSILARAGLRREDVLDQPDLLDARANRIRTEMLKAVRGYAADRHLFAGFPDDVRWRRATLSASARRQRLRYANFPTWVELSGGTRLVTDGARNLDVVQARENVNAHILAVSSRIAAGDAFPELIVVEGAGDSLVLVEGHTRATAHALLDREGEVAVLVGSSPRMATWAFY